jgi:putative transposase
MIASSFRSRATLQTEILALRHQLAVLQANAPRRLRLQRSDRVLWVFCCRDSGRVGADVCRWCNPPRSSLGTGELSPWTGKSRRPPGRPKTSAEIRDLIRRMSHANPLWGVPRIHGELLKLGIEVVQSTVAKYLRRHRKPPMQTWRTFLTNHVEQTVSIDFFTVPTATFRVLFVFIVLSHARRRVVHFGVTEHPSQEWTTQQIREAFPWDQAPKYLLRDRDSIYGKDFAAITTGMGVEEVIKAGFQMLA